ncbi:hypothetical protein [Pedobacter jeongneungensis]|uniref:hypothetical protein n=1 Tax=Pedobacter jeongneungensis TaxID=947309 RepID=UPI00046A98C2|nr:hypothetical protein [Pedobacter jeongneungensis]
MKKNKSKSRNHSAGKKVRKELETKLAAAFGEVVSAYGKAKKADKVIGKFAKQLAKKVTISAAQDSITPFIKEEKAAPVATKTKPAKTVVVKKAKVEVKEENI